MKYIFKIIFVSLDYAIQLLFIILAILWMIFKMIWDFYVTDKSTEQAIKIAKAPTEIKKIMKAFII